MLDFSANLAPAERERYLTPQNRDRLVFATSSFERVVDMIFEGSINFEQFEFIRQHKEKVQDFCDASDTFKSRQDELRTVLREREEQMSEYRDFVSALSTFWQNCKQQFQGKVLIGICVHVTMVKTK